MAHSLHESDRLQFDWRGHCIRESLELPVSLISSSTTLTGTLRWTGSAWIEPTESDKLEKVGRRVTLLTCSAYLPFRFFARELLAQDFDDG